ncbi:MAG: hypothetical protein ABR567_21590 [Myxococcales bacterium]
MRLLFGLALGIISAACSTTPAITVVATPNPVPGDGLTKITITATATAGGSPSSGQTVHFKTDLGTFDNATGTGQLIDQLTDDQGRAIVTMPAPRQGWGTINVTASVSLQGNEPSAKVALPLTPSGGAGASISFTCTSHNVGAFVFNRQSDIHLLCRATAFDAAHRIIPHASVQTLSEAGSLEWIDDNNGVQEFVYTVRPDDPPPKDVMPCDPTSTANCKEQAACPVGCKNDPFGASCAGEPCWIDQTGITHNPRDGVVTLVAAVPGVKDFDTQGEPFVDWNDNGVRDPDEPFIDYNGNGKYDSGDGTSHDRMVWRVFRVIWSGGATIPPLGAGNTHSSFLVQDSLQPTSFKTVFVDANLNNLAADGPSGSDGMAWGAQCAGGNADGTFDVPDTALDQTNPGILFVADTGAISAPGNRSTYTQVSSGNVISSPGGSMAGQSCTVSVKPHRVYDPGAPGFDAEGSDPDNGLAGSFSF